MYSKLCLSPGIVFDNINQSDIQYSIRMSPDKNWQTDATYPVFQFGARVDDVLVKPLL